MVEAHILAAVINSESGNMKSADQSLKQAFSQDFLIRDNPVFMLMRSDIEMKQKDFAAALKTLEYAFNLPQVQDASAKPASGATKHKLPFGQEERVRIFVNYALVNCDLQNYD